ncbi:MAG: methionyl-tRNA formyltransferase [Candidatus Omnitrophica bacterium]|nr:methionyl-tRNA formyltransferase [Candidatus Omnitrophota bacterium]
MIERVLFLGSKPLGLSALEALYRLRPQKLCAVVTIDDTADTRGVLPAFKSYAQKTNIPLHILSAAGRLDAVLDTYAPDMVIVVGWYWRIACAQIRRVPHGILGIHGSLLPKYRGSSPLVWAVLNGETQSGISLFYIEEGIDTGDIVAQKGFDIGPGENIADVLAKAGSLTLGIIEEYYPLLLAGRAPRRPQEAAEASYVTRRTPEDGHIDWSLTSRSIHNAIRAQTKPYPGAYGLTGSGERIYLWRSSLTEERSTVTPGTVLALRKNGFRVACGDRLLDITEASIAPSLKKGVLLF